MRTHIAIITLLIGTLSRVADGQTLVNSGIWDRQSGGNGHQYDVYEVAGGISWSEARSAAEAAGGYLVTCTSDAENSFVFSLISDLQLWVLADNGRSIGPWLGGVQPNGSAEPAGGWQWVTRESWVHTNWASGEPNNNCNFVPEEHLCFWNQSVLPPSSPPQPADTWNDYQGCVGPVRGYVVEHEYTTFCHGDGSGASCPCNNAGAPGRGCMNSSGQSALLTAAGTSTPDTIVFTATGEMPTALTIFLQGISGIPPLPYGDGLRCVGGSLKRLYAKSATSGTVSAPQGGDPSVTARSAQLGDPIPNGAARHYMTYYRDPNQAFCSNPPGSTFNASNALTIVW